MDELSISPGTDIRDAIAQAIAQATAGPVSFLFNEVRVTVAADSAPALLYRDWQRALEGCIPPTVGPYPAPSLSLDELAHDAEVRAENARKQAEAQARYEEGVQRKKWVLAGALRICPPLALYNPELWEQQKAANTDAYGGAVLRYAEAWARLLQGRIAHGGSLEASADEASHLADAEGITGFQYGCAVQILTQCWTHGEALRVWHNRQYGHTGEGVVNPAVLRVRAAGEEE